MDTPASKQGLPTQNMPKTRSARFTSSRQPQSSPEPSRYTRSRTSIQTSPHGRLDHPLSAKQKPGSVHSLPIHSHCTMAREQHGQDARLTLSDAVQSLQHIPPTASRDVVAPGPSVESLSSGSRLDQVEIFEATTTVDNRKPSWKHQENVRCTDLEKHWKVTRDLRLDVCQKRILLQERRSNLMVQLEAASSSLLALLLGPEDGLLQILDALKQHHRSESQYHKLEEHLQYEEAVLHSKALPILEGGESALAQEISSTYEPSRVLEDIGSQNTVARKSVREYGNDVDGEVPGENSGREDKVEDFHEAPDLERCRINALQTQGRLDDLKDQYRLDTANQSLSDDDRRTLETEFEEDCQQLLDDLEINRIDTEALQQLRNFDNVVIHKHQQFGRLSEHEVEFPGSPLITEEEVLPDVINDGRTSHTGKVNFWLLEQLRGSPELTQRFLEEAREICPEIVQDEALFKMLVLQCWSNEEVELAERIIPAAPSVVREPFDSMFPERERGSASIAQRLMRRSEA